MTECPSSSKALKLFNEQIDYFDLVITDQTMPEMTGMEFSKQLIKQRPPNHFVHGLQ